MKRPLVLDAEAFSALAEGKTQRQAHVRAAMRAAARLGRDVAVPAVILAELYRGPRHNQLIDSCLARERGIDIRATDRSLARMVGGVLVGAQLGSAHLADAHVVAVAVEAGAGVILSGDPDDITKLAAAYPSIVVEGIP